MSGADVGKVSGIDFGAMLRARREAQGLDLDGLCAAIGGTPGRGFLARMEEGSVGPSSSLMLKLAAALGLPDDLVLNAGGVATEAQKLDALMALAQIAPPARSDPDA